jgi:ABC-type multidrug transport system fused ATPase/permease subunit
MDEIWVLESGKVIAQGTHLEVMRNSALYRQLWRESEKELEREQLQGVEI